MRDEDGGERLLDNRPEDGDRSADDGQIDLEAGEDDGNGSPPGEVDIGIGGGLVFDNGVEAPDGGENDAVEVSTMPDRARGVDIGPFGKELYAYIPPRTKMPVIAKMFFILRLGLVKMTIGVMKTVRSNTMFKALWLSNRLMNP